MSGAARSGGISNPGDSSASEAASEDDEGVRNALVGRGNQHLNNLINPPAKHGECYGVM